MAKAALVQMIFANFTRVEKGDSSAFSKMVKVSDVLGGGGGGGGGVVVVVVAACHSCPTRRSFGPISLAVSSTRRRPKYSSARPEHISGGPDRSMTV